MLLAITAPTATDRHHHRLLDGLVDRLGRGLVALGTRMARTSPTRRPERTGACRAAEARRRAGEHMRDNAAQVNPLGLR
ncbi:hypothetical protein BCE75_106106 [Isoptericola sp. CG 20/1183]|uniref:Uncharacterized protein n=1 Tax=Isoptericola halotolerans TaxID=300560 RepID=A0ABX5EDG7_9MICO|nr:MULTISPECIES: hypothetical protein [Isoptericola]PRZ06453.1 hypothetical protein BCL65_106128 [Isoptericola halotolerans]PRZ06741.1 hypothetical protein BCE75_106106 [Isoptericola sp. CG 20/1183]